MTDVALPTPRARAHMERLPPASTSWLIHTLLAAGDSAGHTRPGNVNGSLCSRHVRERREETERSRQGAAGRLRLPVLVPWPSGTAQGRWEGGCGCSPCRVRALPAFRCSGPGRAGPSKESSPRNRELGSRPHCASVRLRSPRLGLAGAACDMAGGGDRLSHPEGGWAAARAALSSEKQRKERRGQLHCPRNTV